MGFARIVNALGGGLGRALASGGHGVSLERDQSGLCQQPLRHLHRAHLLEYRPVLRLHNFFEALCHGPHVRGHRVARQTGLHLLTVRRTHRRLDHREHVQDHQRTGQRKQRRRRIAQCVDLAAQLLRCSGV